MTAEPCRIIAFPPQRRVVSAGSGSGRLTAAANRATPLPASPSERTRLDVDARNQLYS